MIVDVDYHKLFTIYIDIINFNKKIYFENYYIKNLYYKLTNYWKKLKVIL